MQLLFVKIFHCIVMLAKATEGCPPFQNPDPVLACQWQHSCPTTSSSEVPEIAVLKFVTSLCHSFPSSLELVASCRLKAQERLVVNVVNLASGVLYRCMMLYAGPLMIFVSAKGKEEKRERQGK